MMTHRILIIGAGIGGLSTAIALAQKGHDVHVWERAGDFKKQGSGISLQPNALQALDHIDTKSDVIAVSKSASAAEIRSHDGRLVKRLSFDDYKERYGSKPITIHRADLLDCLLKKAQSAGATIQFGCSLLGISDDGNKIVAKTTGGDKTAADGLIGADGIRSKVRARIENRSPVYRGYRCWRGIVPKVPGMFPDDQITEIWGNGSRFGYMQCNESDVYWFATQDNRLPKRERPSEDWQVRFMSWVSPVPQLLSMTPPDQIIETDIEDCQPFFPWGKGCITLVGDAAHAMTPNFGQGGAQAIEDAVVLAKSIDLRAEIESAFRVYENHRRNRTRQLVLSSRRYGAIAQGGSWFARTVRNHVLPALPDWMMDKQLAMQFGFHEHLSKLCSK